MSYILYIETSSSICSVCLANGDNIVAELTAPKAQSHSEKLTLLIHQLLQDNNLSTDSLTAIGLSIGPGSYTGLRVGSSVARGLSLALDIPIIAISSLEAIASLHYDNLSSTLVVPMIDARRNEVYHAIYDGSGTELQKAIPIIIDDDFLRSHIKSEVIDKIILSGDGTDKPLPTYALQKLITKPLTLLASHLVFIGFQKYQNQEYADRAYFNLAYIKAPNIIKSTKIYLNR